MQPAYQIATPEVHTPDVTAHPGDQREGMRHRGEAGTDGQEQTMRQAPLNEAHERDAQGREHGLAPGEAARNFLNSAREAVAFVEGLVHPRFRVMLDIGHMAANADDLAASFHHALPYNRYVHLTDDRHLPPGTGRVDFPAVLTAL